MNTPIINTDHSKSNEFGVSDAFDSPKEVRNILQISDFINVLIVKQKWEFIVNDQDVEAAQISDPKGLLSVILWKAEKQSRIIFDGDETQEKAGFGVKFAEDSESIVGVRPVIEADVGSPRSPPLLFALEILEYAQRNYLVDDRYANLDAYVEEFYADKNNGLIPRANSDLQKSTDMPMPN